MPTNTPALPPGPYSLIVADPAIKYKNKAARGAAEDHYETMTIEEIARLPVEEIAAEDAMLGLWIPMSISPTDGELIMRLWGFRYVTRIPWVKLADLRTDEDGTVHGKPQMGPGNYFRNCCEELFIGVRGKATAPDGAKDELGVLFATRTRKHSEKPQEAYVKLARVAPPGARLEMFARTVREGWDRWGLEAPPADASERRERATEAVAAIRAAAEQSGAAAMPEAEIDAEIKATRVERQATLPAGADLVERYGFEMGSTYIMPDGRVGRFEGTSREFVFFLVPCASGQSVNLRYSARDDLGHAMATDITAAIECPGCSFYIAAEAAANAAACPFCGHGGA